MRDFKGKYRRVINLGEVTLEKFEKTYNEMSKSRNMLPVASTVLPVTQSDSGVTRRNSEGKPMVLAVIFYEDAGTSELNMGGGK